MDYVRQTIDMVFKKFEMSLAGSAPNPNFLEADPFVRLTIQDFAFSALSFATEGKILFESFLRIGDITFGECKAGNSKSSGNCKYGQMGVGAASVLREIKEKAIGNPYPSFSQLSPSSQGVVQVVFRSLDSSVAKMNSESEINRALAAVDSKLQQEFEDSVHRARDRFVVEPGTIKMLKKYGDLVSSYVRYSEAVLIEAKGELEAGAALDVSRASLATFPQDQLDEMNLLGNDLREKWKAAVYQACDERGNPNLMNYFSSVPLPLVPGIQEIDLGFEADSVEMAELISVLGSRFSQLPEVVEAEQTYIGHLYGAVSIDFSNRGGSLSQESSRKQYDEMFQAAQSRGNLRSLWIEYSKAVRPEADQAVANKLGVSVDLMKSLDVSEKAPLSVNALYAHRKYVGDSVSLKMFKERMSGLEIGSLMLRISLLGFSYPDTPAAQGPLYGELKRLREILYQQASSPNDPALSDALAQQLLILGQVRAEETKKLEEIIYNVADARPKVDGVASLLGISAEELSVKAVSDGALLSPDMMGVLTIIMGENPNFQGFNF
jgi:hypothetical protein